MTFALLTFALIAALVVGPYWFFILREERGETLKLRQRMKVVGGKKSARPDLIMSETPMSVVPAMDALLHQASFISMPLRRLILQAGLDTTVGTVLLGSLVCGVIVFALVLYATRFVIAGAIVGAAATSIPYFVVKIMAARRVTKFEEQFPEATELLARALRAGHAFTTGLTMVADELPDPVGAEFRLVHDRQSFGMPLTDALRDMAQRVPLLDARFFVTAVLTQRESGGNLSEVLDNLARLMRERFTVRREVRTLSAHGRITGWVLGCLTPTLATILFILAPQHMLLLVTDPLGRFMVAAALFLQVLGVIIIRRIIDIEV
jgi:tight adherence protein B